MLTFPAPDPREGERLADAIEQATGSRPSAVMLVGGEWHIDTEAIAADVRAVVEAHDGTPQSPPDVPGFLIAVMGTLGKPRGREVLTAYPDIHMALRQPYNYTIAAHGLNEALADAFLTQTEYDDIQRLWVAFDLPT